MLSFDGRPFTAGGRWYVGEPKPDIPAYKRVVYVQADGDELTYILDRFENIPQLSSHVPPVMAWTGDIADFIMRNL